MVEDAAVEGIAGDAESTGGDHLSGAFPLSPCPRRRPDLDETQIGGAAPEVGDEDKLVPLDAVLIPGCSGHRLQLEDDVGEAGGCQRYAKAVLSKGIIIAVIDALVDIDPPLQATWKRR